MKKTLYALISALLLFGLLATEPVRAQNLISNPDFETTSVPWVLDNWAHNVASATRTTSNPHSGNYCMQVEMTAVVNTPNVMLSYPGLALSPGMAVEIRFWARGVSNGATLTTMIRKNGDPFTTYFRTETGLTDEWQEYVCIAVMPSQLDSTDVSLRFMLTAVGFFCIDDVSVVVLPNAEGGDVPVLNPVRNPSFEAGTDGWTATVRADEFAVASKESGNIAPTSDAATLITKTDSTAPHGRAYFALTVPTDCRATITSAFFRARYGHPLRLRFSLRSDGIHSFRAGIGSGKNSNARQSTMTLNTSTQWQQYDLPLTLPPAENGVYYVFFQCDEAASMDIDAVSVVEQVQSNPVLYPASVAVQPVDDTPSAHLFYVGDTAIFRLAVTNAAPDTIASYMLSAVDYLERPLWDTIVAVSLDNEGYGDNTFRVPTTQLGAFRIEVRNMDTSTVLAEQLYSVIPVLPAPAQRPDSYFGTHADLTPYNLEIARKAGFRWLRLYPPLTTLWMVTEPSPGLWDFDTSRVATAHNQGFRLIGGFNTAPDFAADIDSASGVQNRWATAFPPLSLHSWKQYVLNCYTNFSPYIDAWEVWNEPDGGYLQVRPGLKKDSVYFSLLESARQVFDSTGFPVTLLGPALANMNDSIGWNLLNRGGDSLINGYSFHFYSLTAGGNNPDNEYVIPLLDSMKTHSNITGDTMPLWITEAGLVGGRSWLQTYQVPPSSPVSVPQIAASVIRSALFFKAQGVKRYLDYHLFASPTGRRIYQDAHSPFTDVTGVATPALAAHAVMVSLIEDLDPLGFEVIEGTTVKVAHFGNGTHSIDVYWSGTATSLSGVADIGPGDQAYDMMGNAVDAQNIQTGEFPIYVVRQ